MTDTSLKQTLDPVPTATPQHTGRSAAIEHLTARRDVTPLDADDPYVKQRLSELRSELTTLVTDLRWGGVTVQETVDRLVPLLDFSPLPQWIPVLIPTILEIDRAGNLVPAWLKLAGEEDTLDLPPDASPAETVPGRARRIAILMLGYYKTPDISAALSKLAVDPHSSLYAAQSLVKQGTVAALQGLVNALKNARGWAKVDVIEAFTKVNQARFYEIMLASGLEDAEGLESAIAAPLYLTVPLEAYLRGGSDISPRLTQQAALVFEQVLHDQLTSPRSGLQQVAFEKDLPTLAAALFEGARKTQDWQAAIALHRLGLLLGRNWGNISRGMLPESNIAQQVTACLPMMPEIEHWMNGPGRVALLEGLASNEQAFEPCMKALRDMREPRAATELLAQLDRIGKLQGREQALRIGQMSDTLVQLGDRRAPGTLLQLMQRTIPIQERVSRPRRSDNLPGGDSDIPASIVYGAALRTFAQFRDRAMLDHVLYAANDFDPYVRTQAAEALKNVDPQGEDARSRGVARVLLNDQRDAVVRVACQLLAQYHDSESIPLLTRLIETRPEYASMAQDALRRLG